MINFLIKFFNISSIIFLLNILVFSIFVKILPITQALFFTLIIIFILNFLFITYSFNIGKNKTYFLFGLIFLSIFFRFIEYNLFIRLIQIFYNETLTWFFSITISFIIKIFIYKIYFNLKLFENSLQRKKIFIFTPSLNKGGAEKNTYLLSKAFDLKKFDINLILWSKSSPKIKGIKSQVIQKKNLRSSFFTILILLIKNNPDYIFSSLNHMNIFIGIIKIFSGIKSNLVIRESNLLSLKLNDELKNNKFNIRLRKLLTSIIYNCSQIVICPSKEIQNDLRNNFLVKKKKLKFIPNLFEKKIINLNQNSISDSNNLLSLGRLEQQKDYIFMIKAFHQSLKIKKNQLIIFGNGSQKKKIKDLIKKLSIKKYVKILSFRKNIDKYLINSKAILLTSKYEGMPNVVIEATSYGIKCLLTNFPGSSYFKSYKNVKIVKKNLKEYSKEIIKLNSKRIISQKFLKDFIESKNQKKFLNCFK